jgi:hypothetical protein
LTHGRVAMLAAVGILVGEFVEGQAQDALQSYEILHQSTSKLNAYNFLLLDSGNP